MSALKLSQKKVTSLQQEKKEATISVIPRKEKINQTAVHVNQFQVSTLIINYTHQFLQEQSKKSFPAHPYRPDRIYFTEIILLQYQTLSAYIKPYSGTKYAHSIGQFGHTREFLYRVLQKSGFNNCIKGISSLYNNLNAQIKENGHEQMYIKQQQSNQNEKLNRAGMSPLFFVLHIEPLAHLDQTNRQHQRNLHK